MLYFRYYNKFAEITEVQQLKRMFVKKKNS